MAEDPAGDPVWIELQTKLAFLERHVAQQDAEMYRLSQRIAALQQSVTELDAQLEHLRGQNGPAQGGDEKPPHY